MRLANLSLPKIASIHYKCDCGKTHGINCELLFYTKEKAVAYLKEKYPYITSLLLLDEETAQSFQFLKRDCKCFTLILKKGDNVDNLFSLSDEISLVICYGGQYVLQCARYFSEVRKIPLAVFSFRTSAKGLLEKECKIELAKEKEVYIAKKPDIIFYHEEFLCQKDWAQTYAWISLHILSLFEMRFLNKMGKEYCTQLYELSFRAVVDCLNFNLQKNPATTLFESAFLLRFCQVEGMEKSEGEIFAELLKEKNIKENAEIFAFKNLLNLYCVFFQFGIYRKYYTPNYSMRIRSASMLFGQREESLSNNLKLFTSNQLEEEYEKFKIVQATFCKACKEIKEKFFDIEKKYCLLGGKIQKQDNTIINQTMKYMAEISPRYSIVTIMRNFGLMDD